MRTGSLLAFMGGGLFVVGAVGGSLVCAGYARGDLDYSGLYWFLCLGGFSLSFLATRLAFKPG